RPLLQHRVDGRFSYSKESIWSLGGETWLVLPTENSVWQRELDFRILQEKYCWSTALASSDLLNLHDLNRVSTGTMTGSHIAVCNKRT
ncbi:hypothetical protein N339_07734, partial [Pterocles gutturalis]